MKEHEECIRDVGVTINLERGIEAVVSYVTLIVVGVIAEFPPNAISAMTMVSFSLSAFMEFPGGVIADILGKIRSVKVCYLTGILSGVAMILAIYFKDSAPRVMWLLIVFIGILDALGHSLLSGSREAIYQEVIEKGTSSLPPKERKEIAEKGFSLSERHGRFFPFIAPIVAVGGALYAYDRTGNTAAAVAAVSLLWCVAYLRISWLCRRHEVRDGRLDEARETYAGWKRALKQTLLEIWSGNRKINSGLFILAMSTFSMILIGSYLNVSFMRDPMLAGSSFKALPVVALTIAFSLGQLVRTYILPALTRRWPIEKLILVGSAGMIVISLPVAALLRGAGTHSVGIGSLFAYCLVFPTFISLIQRPATGLLLANSKKEIHATLFSLQHAVTLILHGLYGAFLTFTGLGVQTLGMTVGITGVVGIGIFIVVFAALYDASPLPVTANI